MLPRLPAFARGCILALVVGLTVFPGRGWAQGIVLPGVGPVNRSMGGASTAAPLDASGALYWNPATIAGLGRSEMEFGLELLQPHAQLESTVAAGALGPGFPPVPLGGTTSSNTGVSPLPSFGLVYQPPESCWTYGLGVFAVGGFGAKYPASTTNPILTPQPPNGIGVGAVYSQLQVLQIVPSVAWRLTDRLAIGFSPTINLAGLAFDPALVAPPDDANGNGFSTYPAATHGRYAWGIGCQVGLYYTTPEGWHLGASIKTPQWLETFRFDSSDELGRPRPLSARFDYPLIGSIGASYTGLERWVLAADVRYIDYHNTQGFRATGFDAAGALRGVGWQSIMLLALGGQYQLSDTVSLRMGYTYSPNPIDDLDTAFNVASASILEHALYFGVSYNISEALKLSACYGHGFENSISGPIQTRLGPAPGTSVTNRVSVDTVQVGVQVLY